MPVTADFICIGGGGAPLRVDFTDESFGVSHPITSWAWDFGDPGSGADNTSTLKNPSHVFTTPGIYTVTETVSGLDGTGSVSKQIEVLVRPDIAPLGLLHHSLESGSGCTVSGIAAPASTYLGGATLLLFLLIPSGTDMAARDGGSFDYSSLAISDDTTPGAYGTRLWTDGGNQYYVKGAFGTTVTFTGTDSSDEIPFEGAWGVALVMNEITDATTITIDFGDTYSGMTVLVLGYTGVQFDNKHEWPDSQGTPFGPPYQLDFEGIFEWVLGSMLPTTSIHRTGVNPTDIMGGWQTDTGDETIGNGTWYPALDYGHNDWPTSQPAGTVFDYGDELANPGSPALPPGRPAMTFGHYLVVLALAPAQYNQIQNGLDIVGGTVPAVQWVPIEAGSLTIDEPITTRLAADDLAGDAGSIGGGGSGQSILLGDEPIASQGLVYPDAYHLVDNSGSGRNAEGTVTSAGANDPYQVAFGVAYFSLALIAGLGPWVPSGQLFQAACI